MYSQRKDANESRLIETARALGAHVIQMDRTAGFDLLIVTPKGVHIVEVKNPAQHWHLTDAEVKTKKAVEQAGQMYNVIKTDDELIELLFGR